MNNDEIMVSIICKAYNHENYIEDAIKSFLMQKTSFKFEVLIHDDASTDKTVDIIRKYEREYPDIIKAIYQKENQYSKGINITKYFQISRAKGKYIAVCEGDDYWTDPNKLQKQYEALELHPEIDICAHNNIAVNAVTGELVDKKWVARANIRIATVEEVILGEGGFVATNSLFFRKEIFEKELPFRKMMAYDYTLQIMGALAGGMICLPEFMSAYRFAVPNSYCSRLRKGNQQEVLFMNKKKEMLFQLDKDTNYQFHDAITGRLMLYEVVVEKNAIENLKTMLKYRNGFGALSMEDKTRVLVKCFCPSLLRLKHKLYVTKRSKIQRDLEKKF